MVLWVAFMVVMFLLVFEWERTDKLRARAERAEHERDAALASTTEMLTLPSGAKVEVFSWPAPTPAGRHPEWN